MVKISAELLVPNKTIADKQKAVEKFFIFLIFIISSEKDFLQVTVPVP